MPSQKIQTVQLRDFTGISVKTNATDQPPGTMHRADGVNTVPAKSLSFGPTWNYAWNSSALGTAIASALSGATANTVAFVTVELGETKFLVAWNVTTNRPRGIWHVAGTGDPNFTSLSSITIYAPNIPQWRGYTTGLDWYGSWNQNQLWLGNGTDSNVVWETEGIFTGLNNLGWLIGNSFTNLLANSESFGSGWTATGSPTRVAAAITAQIGSQDVSMDLIGDVTGSATNYYMENVALPSNGLYGFSILVSRGSIPGVLQVQITDATAAVDLMRATISFVASTTPVVSVSIGTLISSVYLGSNNWRVSVAAISATASHTNTVYVVPAITNAANVYAGGVQVMSGSYMSPYVKTTNTASTTGYPSSPQDPSQVVFPPSKSFLVGSEGQVYSTGNITYPLRVWCGEPPSINYSINQGMKTTDYAWLQLQTQASSTTALSNIGADLIVHYNYGPPSIISGFTGSRAGWKLRDSATEANASAINPNCTRDNKVSSLYLGADLELYRLETYKGSITSRQYNTGKWRKGDITTDPGSSIWNNAATKPISGNDYTLIEDQKNGRTWAWLNMSATSRQGLYCFEDRTNSITGPWFYPDFLSVCQLRDENLSNVLVCGITRDGAFLWSDLQAIGDFVPASYTSSLPVACAELSSAPTPVAGIGYVGVSADGQQFKYVLNSQTINLATPWSEWAVGDVTCTKFYDGARIAVVEFAEGDCSLQAVQKEFLAARLILDRNSCIYYGAYCECNGYRYGGWRGLAFPSVDWLAAIGGEGSTYKLRLIIVSFNSVPKGVLSGVNVDFFPSVLD